MASFTIPTKVKRPRDLPRDLETFTEEDLKLIQSTRATLLAEIEKAIVSSGELDYWVTGQYPDEYMERTLANWKKCNPAIAYAVDEIYKELRRKKWKPLMNISYWQTWDRYETRIYI